MNYIYDIHLNFNEILYDFFDWNKKDKITHIKKTPIFKLNNQDFQKIINNNIQINSNFLKEINNKTESWYNDIEYKTCAAFTDSSNIIIIQFNNFGKSIKRSILQLDEELEALNSIKANKEITIPFKIISKSIILNKTRKQIDEEKFINNELKSMNNSKLEFIYFECFNKKEKNKNLIIKNIKKMSKSSKNYKKLLNILKLTSIAKKNDIII